jgi:putrescine---pyruvate transaminase
VTSGYLPLGGVIVAPGVAAPFWSDAGSSFAHGSTYSGHATCCAAALANLDVLGRDGLVFRASLLEDGFAERLRTPTAHACVGEVRGGIGLIAGVTLREDVLARDPKLASRFWSLAREQGVLTRGLFHGVAVAPPLIIEDDDIDLIVSGLDAALTLLELELEASGARKPSRCEPEGREVRRHRGEGCPRGMHAHCPRPSSGSSAVKLLAPAMSA